MNSCKKLCNTVETVSHSITHEPDILQHIFYYAVVYQPCDGPTIIAIAQTCKRFYHVLSTRVVAKVFNCRSIDDPWASVEPLIVSKCLGYDAVIRLEGESLASFKKIVNWNVSVNYRLIFHLRGNIATFYARTSTDYSAIRFELRNLNMYVENNAKIFHYSCAQMHDALLVCHSKCKVIYLAVREDRIVILGYDQGLKHKSTFTSSLECIKDENLFWAVQRSDRSQLFYLEKRFVEKLLETKMDSMCQCVFTFLGECLLVELNNRELLSRKDKSSKSSMLVVFKI
jgi:hypothetical protein